ncbi:helix-turn-helix domain-containing protein [Streptomyces sp. NPDC045431]|uniref:helix-turn-helix domain-containing protein n=1 Tax=Streptomyces sp. NPDC045431 TaxID=3155613 RepID=UPI0033C435F3
MRSRAKEADTQQRVYRFRFYPTPEQAQQLERTFGACRWVYNQGLTLRSEAWEKYRVSVGFAETGSSGSSGRRRSIRRSSESGCHGTRRRTSAPASGGWRIRSAREPAWSHWPSRRLRWMSGGRAPCPSGWCR